MSFEAGRAAEPLLAQILPATEGVGEPTERYGSAVSDFPSNALLVPNPPTPLICAGAALHYCGLAKFCNII